jgi:hypothetical protein
MWILQKTENRPNNHIAASRKNVLFAQKLIFSSLTNYISHGARWTRAGAISHR